MKDAVAQLQALRKGRERRAEGRLAASQRALQEAQWLLEDERRRLAQARTRVREAAELLQRALVTGGLASGRYLEACDGIALLRRAVATQENAVRQAAAVVTAQRQARDADQRRFAHRHRQVEALVPWLERQALGLLRAREGVEEILLEERRHLGRPGP